MLNTKLFLKAILIGVTAAVPFEQAQGLSLFGRQAQPATPRALTSVQQSAYAPHARFASAAYCLQSDVKTWNCGVDCEAVPAFNKNVTVGGNNFNTVPYYVGFNNDTTDLTMTGNNDTTGTIVVSHQGTPNVTGSFLFARLGQLGQVPLDPSIFGTISDSAVAAHSGFVTLHSFTANEILASVSDAMKKYNTKKVLVTGHSLGGALSVLTALQLKQKMPGAIVSTISFASPRVGNKALANYVASKVNVVRHINNKDDIVPVTPGRTAADLQPAFEIGLLESLLGAYGFLGSTSYSGQVGEIHIVNNGTWFDCGATVEDNESPLCSTGTVRTVDRNSIMAAFGTLGPMPMTGSHNGPYNGVGMGKGCRSLNPFAII